MIKRVWQVIAAVVVALLIGASAPSHAAPIEVPTSAGYSYASLHHSALPTYTTTERGPPATYDRHTTYDAVDRWSHGASVCPSAVTAGAATTYTTLAEFVQVARSTGTTQEQARGDHRLPTSLVRSKVAAKSVDDLASIGFRSDTSHIFRNAAGHLADDTVENRALIKSALDPANLRDTISLKDDAALQKYFRDLLDGTQAWAEVRNGEITNGGLNVIPR